MDLSPHSTICACNDTGIVFLFYIEGKKSGRGNKVTDFTTKIHRHTRQEMEKEKCKALLMVAVFLSMYPQLGISSHNNNCNWNHNSNNARACGDPDRNCAGHVGADGSLTLDFPGINTRHQYTGHYDLCEIDCPGAEGSPASLCDKITWPFKQNEYSSLDNYGIIRILEGKRLEIRGQARLRNSYSKIEVGKNSKFIVHGTLTATSSSTITTSIGSQIIVHGSFDGYSMSTSFTLGQNAQLIVHGTLQTSSGITIPNLQPRRPSMGLISLIFSIACWHSSILSIPTSSANALST